MNPSSSTTSFNNFPNPPPQSNPPPQIFGNYASGAGNYPQFPLDTYDYGFGDFEYGDGDSAEAKRRRIARACDMCRKKKIKCDGKQPCAHCVNYKTDCAFTFTEKKRAQPKGAKYVEGLENRLGRMEHLLRLTGLLGEDEPATTDLGVLEQRLTDRVRASQSPMSDHRRSIAARGGGSTRGGTPRSPSPPKGSSAVSPQTNATTEDQEQTQDGNRDVDDLAEMMDSLITNTAGETRYIGSSSGVSIFSPTGIKWVTQKTGDAAFAQMVSSAAPTTWYHWKPEVFGDIFARQTYQELPPREVCIDLLGDCFEHFNSILPLFHEPTFMHLVDMQYSGDPYEGSGWWASLNVTLAIACRMRAMKIPSGPGRTQQEAMGWAYFKNALAVVPELFLKNTDLFTVQALVGMCLFLQGTPNPQPSFGLIGAAMRSAQSIGLHKRGQGHGFNPVELEQRKRVFWIAYLVDKDICLRSGRPPAQEDSDWNVELPSVDPEDGMGNVALSKPDKDGKTTFNLFRTMCEFSVIQSQVFQRLYSVKASRQTNGQLLEAISDLDAQLEKWKDSVPVEFRPEHDIITQDPAITVNIAVLHFAYYNCVSTIHRRSIMQGVWSSRLAQYALDGRNATALNHRVFQSKALSVAAARLSIALLKYIPQSDYSLVWLVIYYPVSALVTVFGHIILNPQDPRARSDLELVNMVVTFLGQVTLIEETGSTRKMYEICHAFEGIARNAVDKAEREMNTRQKRKHERDQKKYGSVDLGGSKRGAMVGLQQQQHGQQPQQLHQQQQQMRQQQQGSHSHQPSPQAQPRSSLDQSFGQDLNSAASTSSTAFNQAAQIPNAAAFGQNVPTTQPFNPALSFTDQSLLANNFAGLQSLLPNSQWDPVAGMNFMQDFPEVNANGLFTGQAALDGVGGGDVNGDLSGLAGLGDMSFGPEMMADLDLEMMPQHWEWQFGASDGGFGFPGAGI